MSTIRVSAVIAAAIVSSVCGCAAQQEKTAPCKRPAELTGYADPRLECAEMRSINAQGFTAQQAADRLARQEE